jgi:hypothetical protein
LKRDFCSISVFTLLFSQNKPDTCAFRWITVWLENTGNVIMLGCAMLAVWEHDRGTLSPGACHRAVLKTPSAPPLLFFLLAFALCLL